MLCIFAWPCFSSSARTFTRFNRCSFDLFSSFLTLRKASILSLFGTDEKRKRLVGLVPFLLSISLFWRIRSVSGKLEHHLHGLLFPQTSRGHFLCRQRLHASTDALSGCASGYTLAFGSPPQMDISCKLCRNLLTSSAVATSSRM